MEDRPSIHVVGIPHTIVNNNYSHCAFTGKIFRFSKMLKPHGWRIVEYSNGRSESEASVHVEILTEKELKLLSKRKSEREDYGADVNNANLVDTFTGRVVEELKARTKPGDIVCHVFGPSSQVARATPKCYQVESGIGYTCHKNATPHRVFESSAWMHWHAGRREKEFGSHYEFVVPNYYDLDEWDVVEKPGAAVPYVLFFGRVTSSKGLDEIVEVARRLPNMKFIICGQGDFSAWEGKAENIERRDPVCGRDRAPLVGNASVMVALTKFIEPFCGSAVEAQLCGVPVVSTSYGAFHETIEDGKTGYRCTTLADIVEAVRRAPSLDRKYIAERARRLYSLEAVGKKYDRVFKYIADLRGKGWYGTVSRKFGGVVAFDDQVHETPQARRLAEYVTAEVKPRAVKGYGVSSDFYLREIGKTIPKNNKTGPRLGLCVGKINGDEWREVLGNLTKASDRLIFVAKEKRPTKLDWVDRFRELGWAVDARETVALAERMEEGAHEEWFVKGVLVLSPSRE